MMFGKESLHHRIREERVALGFGNQEDLGNEDGFDVLSKSTLRSKRNRFSYKAIIALFIALVIQALNGGNY